MFSFFKNDTHQPVQGVYRAYLNSQNSYTGDKLNDTNTKKGSFALRFFVSVLMFGGYLAFTEPLRQEIHAYMIEDYTKNVFAFMSDLAYTLDYEKTSIK